MRQCRGMRPSCVYVGGWLLCASALGGCSGIQSSLDPAGAESAFIATLFWWMAGGALVVWFAVIGLAFYCARPPGGPVSRSVSNLLIIGGGVVIPTVVLAALLVYSLVQLPRLVARAPDARIHVSVVGEQWWWRVRYDVAGQTPVELANEIRLPVGERVQFRLESDNVIHSFWIPSLAGKIDMIPGRVTYLSLQPTQTGLFRGVCAEYCGTSHAQMAFYVEVMERDGFERWLNDQAAPARRPAAPDAIRGEQLFLGNGCSACHRVNGTAAMGVIGPDLTHVGSRRSIAAGILPNDTASLEKWLREAPHVKPGVHMPHFRMLPREDVLAIAAYLRALE